MTRWDIDKGEGYMWIGSEAAKSLMGSMKKEAGIHFKEHITYVKDMQFWWCLPEKELVGVGNYLVKRFKNAKFSERFVKKYRSFDKKAIKELEKIDKVDINKLSNKRILNIYKKANDIYIKNWDFGFIMEPMDFVMPGLLESALASKGYTHEEISDMLAIADISYLNMETQELINIAKSKDRKKLLKHAYKYRWFLSDHGGRKDIPTSFFEEKIKDIKKTGLDNELFRLKNFKRNINSRKRRIIQRKPLGKKEKQLLLIAETVAPLHDRRKELFLRSVYTVDTIREELSKRYGLTKEQTSTWIYEDFLKIEKNQLDKEKIRSPSADTLLYINTPKKIWGYYYGVEADRIAEKELKIDLEGINEIKGMIASQGKVKGKVTIICSTSSLHKMKPGNILVSSMTKPEFISAIKKASAIVTDEGGVTCHAAIVSREFSIPCIIGTKYATHILKDGDEIEVDANKGIVKIMKVK